MKLAAVALGILVGAEQARAQHAAGPLVRADSAYVKRQTGEALVLYREAVRTAPKSYEALWKTSRTEVDIAEAMPEGAAMDSLLESARRHAERARQVSPDAVDGHFALARALGRKAMSVGTMDRIRYSKMIYAEALEALTIDSLHAGALHVMGMWNAEIMRVNGFARAFAKTFLGAQIFGKANWGNAEQLLRRAVRMDPNRIVHTLDLAGILADRGKRDEARALYATVVNAPLIEPNDDIYKHQASARLKVL